MKLSQGNTRQSETTKNSRLSQQLADICVNDERGRNLTPVNGVYATDSLKHLEFFFDKGSNEFNHFAD